MSVCSVTQAEERDARIGAILNEHHDLLARGQAINVSDLVARHPELGDELRSALDLLDKMAAGNPPGPDRCDEIETLITCGVLSKACEAEHRAELGPYRIIELIGRGGMGIVFRAYEPALDRMVALKILRPEFAEHAEARSRFVREATAAAKVQHPNVVTVYGAGDVNGVAYISMEHVVGPSLAGVLENGHALTDEETREVFRQLLTGLAAAHEAGLIHRDIKPANVLLGGWPGAGARVEDGESSSPQPPRVKIADFGLARIRSVLNRITLPDARMGTPVYMSPEQARGDRNIDHRTDLYSAGVVLYEMLTGQTPFNAETPAAVLHKILHDEPPNPRVLNRSVDPNLCSLALRLMAKLPEDRFSSATGSKAALESGKRIGSFVYRRRLRKRGVVVLSASVAAVALVWLASHFIARAPDIIAVRENPDPKLRHIVQIFRSDDGNWRDFRIFPKEVGSVIGMLLDRDATGKQQVIVGLHKPLGGKNVFGFGSAGDELWSLSISNTPPHRKWPDCGSAAHWPCRLLAVGDLDGQDGDEVVVVASDSFNYPTRLSAIDPRTPKIRSTFWHMGHIHGVLIAPDCSGPGRPAIVAWATNNKLDGFGPPYRPRDSEWPAGEDRPRTRYDQVSVVMVLDPADMDGLGPPRTRRDGVKGIAIAHPLAYAFLDKPISERSGSYVPEGSTKRVFPTLRELGAVDRIVLLEPEARSGDGRWMKVFVGGPQVGSAVLTVDRNLNVLDVELVSGSPAGITKDHWRSRWRPIIQDGEYLDE